MQGGRVDDAEASCNYCGWALDDSAAGESGDRHVRVPIPCAHGGLVRTRGMLDPADRIAKGHTDLRPCVTCQSAWPKESQPLHLAEPARELPMTEHGGGGRR